MFEGVIGAALPPASPGPNYYLVTVRVFIDAWIGARFPACGGQDVPQSVLCQVGRDHACCTDTRHGACLCAGARGR